MGLDRRRARSSIALFQAIHSHYASVAASLKVDDDYKPRRMNHTVVVLVGTVHRGVLEALAYAKSLHPNRLLAVTVVSDEEEQEKIERQWASARSTCRSRSCTRPTASSPRPILRFIDELDARYENDIITVVRARVRRGLVVGPAAPQPERADAEGPAAVPQGHRRDVGPVPPGGLTSDRSAHRIDFWVSQNLDCRPSKPRWKPSPKPIARR